MVMTAPVAPGMPGWLPDCARLYLRHVEEGVPLRALARAEGCHASTILRRVRRVEERRDDPLIDAALAAWGGQEEPAAFTATGKDVEGMTAPIRSAQRVADEEQVAREGQRILRRLAEPGAMLVVAPDMDKAVVMRAAVRTAVTDRAMAQAFALRDWVQLRHSGRVAGYEITAVGRAALRRMLADERIARGVAPEAEDDPAHSDPKRDWGERDMADDGGGARRVRVNLAESPLGVLARRRDADGRPFLAPDLVAAGERLREDFELAQMGPRVAQNWERFLTGGERGQYRAPPIWVSGRSVRAKGWRRPCATSGRGSAIWCCGAVVSSRGSKRRSGVWAGRRGQERSFSGLP